MVLRSRREVQEEFQKIKLEIEMTKNKMLKGKLCSSCYCKQLREEIVKLKILVTRKMVSSFGQKSVELDEEY
ncbi:hypothetical protein H5410_055111 [Solanum commersonii]|uniref:Uncharacterized protein n=1 Tax=Solanum commersonii TaxID=4109 RepID=A0A9J5WGQ1_SOLCO|nr:hypothetical protein H5410_055111 [Solanum commersonii]